MIFNVDTSEVIEDRSDNYDVAIDLNLDNPLKFNKEFIEILFQSEEEFLEKNTFEDDSQLNKFLVLQSYKVINNPADAISFLIGNATWMIISLILLMSLFFKLLYIKHDFYLAEHIIFHLYGHLRIILCLLFGLILSLFFEVDIRWWCICCVTLGMIYFILGMKTFYQQSMAK